MSDEKKAKLSSSNSPASNSVWQTAEPLDIKSEIELVETPSPAAPHNETKDVVSVTSHQSDELIGQLIEGKYLVKSKIGMGATSSVYAGTDQTSKHEIAIKVLHKHLSFDEGVVRRFLQEAKTASVLIHPNIIRLHSSGKTATEQPYFAMELAAGKSMQQLISDKGGALPWQEVLDIAIQVCAALGAAHQRGVVHRDIKPTNIMVNSHSDGRNDVKVLDFGIAKVLPAEGETYFKATQTGETLGSLLYMSPEQCLDEDVDGRTDVYSIGCVIYEALLGKPAFAGRTAFLTMNQHLTNKPDSFVRARPDLKLPQQLQDIVFKSVERKPQDRFQTIGELQDQLIALRGKTSFKTATEFAEKAPASNNTDAEKIESMRRQMELMQKQMELLGTSSKHSPAPPAPIVNRVVDPAMVESNKKRDIANGLLITFAVPYLLILMFVVWICNMLFGSLLH